MAGAFDVVLRLMNAQGRIFLDKGELPFSADKPKNFLGLSMFLMGKDSNDYISAGDTITTLFDHTNRAHGGPKRPGAPHRSSPSDGVATLETRLTEYEFGKELFWHEMKLNGGDPLTPEGSQKIWSIAEKKNKEFIVGMAKTLERDIFATPTENMFTGNGDGSFPIKSFWTGCNEWGIEHGVPGEGLMPGMTDQQGQDPEDPKFRRTDGYGLSQLAATKIGYGESGNNRTDVPDHLIDQMDFLINLLPWDPTPLAGEFADGIGLMPKMMVTSREGRSLFLRTNRAHGDLFATMSPIGNPAQSNDMFGRIPIMVSDSVANSEIYPDTQGTFDPVANAAEFADAVNRAPVNEYNDQGIVGPRFYMIDGEASSIYCHKDRAVEIGDWKNLDQINEDLYRKLAKAVFNFHHERFVTHGILRPTRPVPGYQRAA